MKKPSSKNPNKTLRKKAEQRLKKQTGRLADLSGTDMKHLVHELGTHQIELEMQNEELRQAQVELEDSRRKFAELYNFAPVGYFTLDRKGKIIESNVTGAEMLGSSRRLLANKPFSQYIASGSDRLAFFRHLAGVVGSKAKGAFEIRLRSSKDASFYAHIESVPIEDEQAKTTLIHAAVSDITEIKRTEEALRESENIHRTLTQNIPDIVYRVYLQQGEMKFFNNRIIEITGYTPGELRKGAICSIEPYILKEDRQRVSNIVRRAIRDRSPFEVEYRFRHKSGPILTLLERSAVVSDESGAPVFIDGIIRDITEHKRAEDARRESEEKYRSLFDSMTEGFAIHEIVIDERGKPVDYRFLDANKAFEKLTGLKVRDIVGKRATGVLSGIENDPADWIGRYGRVALTGEASRFEQFAAPLDKWYSVTAYSPVKGIFATIFEDITERKKAEQALRQNEEQFRRAIEEAPIPVIMHAEDGEVLQISRTWTKLTGYSIEDIRSFDEWTTHAVYGEGADKVRDHLRALFTSSSSSSSSRVDFSVLTKTGETRYWSFSASVPGKLSDGRRYVVGMALDITERMQAEQALRESERKFFLLFQKAGFGVALETSPDGVFVDVNEAAERMFGYSRQELVGKNSLDLGLHPDPDARARIFAALTEKGSLSDFETKLRTRSGEERFYLINIIPVAFGDRNHNLVTLVDITDRKRYEDDVLRLSEDIAARNLDLEALSNELEAFNHSVSHELRAPLRSMSGFSSALAEEYADKLDEKGKDYLARIRRGSEKMTNLIDALLNLSAISRQNIDRMDIDLSRLAASVVHSLREASPERNVTIVIQADLRAAVDPNLFRIVLSNLFDNAWKFSERTENARIEFGAIVRGARTEETGDGTRYGRPSPGVLDPSPGTVYFIRDNGAGFDQKYADKMFWPFHRLHNERDFPGTGIGLAISDRIIRRHGGRIWAEGAVGKGATVYFTIG